MTKSKNQPARKAFRRPHLFGPPPILEGEEADAYNEILDRVFDAIAPTDFPRRDLGSRSRRRDVDNTSMAAAPRLLRVRRCRRRQLMKRYRSLKPKPN